MSAIKILVISNYRNWNVMRPEAEIFIDLQKLGFEVEIMTYPDAEYIQRFESVGIKVHKFHPQKKRTTAQIQKIRQILIDGKHDILQLFNPAAMHNGIPAAVGLPVKIVLYSGYTSRVSRWDLGMMRKYLHPRVDKIICLAESVKQGMEHVWFFDKSKLKTINKGHDLAWYADVQAADLQSEFGISPETFVAVHVSNTRKMKGTPYLLQASALLPREVNLKIIIVGSGFDHPKFEKYLDKNPNRDKLIFASYRNDSLSIVKSSDTFLLTSVKGEATTKSVIEAMSLGVTPIVTDIPGNVDLVLHEKQGLVVPSKNSQAVADALLRLYNDRKLLEIYGAASREHIRIAFSHERTVREYAAFYESLVQKN